MQTKKTNSFVFCLLSFVLILFSFFLFLFSCERSTAPDYNPQNLQLQVLDVSCTEAWLSLKAKNDYINKTLKLFQDDSLKLEKKLTTEDSILFVENLRPNSSYQFQVTVYDGNKLIAKSSTVSATTMDTTSHNFTWQTFEFGGQ
ncbi:MAG: fibronectin type III domain-containing protein, partial [Caldisericaceae bacterium]|nr:fibronectin type III domain-containing protein [Caldisericaceae bacterium]